MIPGIVYLKLPHCVNKKITKSHSVKCNGIIQQTYENSIAR